MPRSRSAGCALWRVWAAAAPAPAAGGRRGRGSFTPSGRPSMRCIAERPAGAPQSGQSTPRGDRSRGINHLTPAVPAVVEGGGCERIPAAPALIVVRPVEPERRRGIGGQAALRDAPAEEGEEEVVVGGEQRPELDALEVDPSADPSEPRREHLVAESGVAQPAVASAVPALAQIRERPG